MHMSLFTFYRAALLPLTLNPLFIARASTTTIQHQTAHLLQSPNRPFSSIFHQCPSSLQFNQYSTSSSSSPSNMSSQSDQQNQQPDQTQQDQQPSSPYLALPDSSTASATQLDMSEGGDSVKLDHLGPLVVNQDGSLARITNWAQMTEIEKKNTLRVLGKRNKQRLEALKAAEAASGENKSD